MSVTTPEQPRVGTPNEELFQADFNEDGKIVDFLDSTTLLEDRPEERVRQAFLKHLHFDLGYPRDVMRREVPIYSGQSEVRDQQGNPIRADIVVYLDRPAAATRDQGRMKFVVECKRPDVDSGYNQLVSYIYNTSAGGGVWTNGSDMQAYKRVNQPHSALNQAPQTPRADEGWDAVGRPRTQDLLRPHDFRRLLRMCHNKLHGRGVDSEEEDLTMDMVRIILAKYQDEVHAGEYVDFYCTDNEYGSATGREQVAERIQRLFRDFANDYPSVFGPHERITVSPSAITEVVAVLQNYTIITGMQDADGWDVMGSAYEQYTATHLKRQRGQFFTNRLVVNFMVDLLDPDMHVKALDPAGGSGGFVTSILRFLRHKIASSSASDAAKEQQLGNLKQHLFLVEASSRLVKIAKTAMILNGDGHSGMTQGNSLGPYEEMDDWIKARCTKGQPGLILTNPPFAGVGQEGAISDPQVLDQFITAKPWEDTASGLQPVPDSTPRPSPPELLFFERCLDWLAPGGLLGIVLPKSFLDTATFRASREYLFRNAKLLATVNLHKNTFQPDTGVRTCLVFLRKLKADEVPSDDYGIFMAVSRKIGRDSEGQPIFVPDSDGNPTAVIDHDLDEILDAYKAFAGGTLTDSEYTFAVKRTALGSTLNINPQFHLPHLNESVRRVQAIDQVAHWSVTPLGQLDNAIKIFKGPRLRTENVLVDGPASGSAVEAYFTPSALLQDRRDSVKWLDLAKATQSQKRAFDAVRVKKGDLLITRSGSIGRVAYVTSKLDQAIVSDDAIRVRIPDERLRAYVYSWLNSPNAQDQFRRNEYGAIQQHLEPIHVRDLLVPVPEDWEQVSDLVTQAKAFFEGREKIEAASDGVLSQLEQAFGALLRSDNGDEHDSVDE